MSALDDLIRARRALDAATRRMHRIRVHEQLILELLAHDGPQSPTTLAQHVGMTTGGMTTLLDRMERSDLATRAQRPDDRRSTVVTITPHGRTLQAHRDQVDDLIETLFVALSAADGQVVGDFLAAATAITIEAAEAARFQLP